MIMKMETRCRSVHARGFTAGQKYCGKSGLGHRAAGPSWAVGRRAAGRLDRGPAFIKTRVRMLLFFLSYRFPSPDGKVLGQMSRGQVCWLAL